MKNIRELLSKRPAKKERGVDEKAIESVFYNILKKEIPGIGRADIQNFRFRSGKIFLKTVHPAIAAEIWRKRERISKEMNSSLGSGIVEDIKAK
jgi:hypothetical protein